MLSSARRALSGMLRDLARMDATDLALRLTLFLLLLQPVGNWRVRPFVLALAAAGLLIPGLFRRPATWALLTLLMGWRLVLEWPVSDNHAYLLSYWCLAIFIALLSEDGASLLARNGRLLIGWAFAFATLWKLALSPDYLDGTFFRVTLLLDPRLEGLTLLLGGMTPDLLESHRDFLTQHVDGRLFGPLLIPPVPAAFTHLAQASSLWTVTIEGAVAVAFFWPIGRGFSRQRDALLLVFCLTTYAVAPVAGFGWLLVTLGIAQCDPERRRTRLLYLAAFIMILFYRDIPWAKLLSTTY